jgi:hypothetical protein
MGDAELPVRHAGRVILLDPGASCETRTRTRPADATGLAIRCGSRAANGRMSMRYAIREKIFSIGDDFWVTDGRQHLGQGV